MNIYVNETRYPNCFSLTLPDGVNLSGEIGLSEIHVEFTKDVECFDLCCDACQPSVVDREMVPVLRRIHVKKRNENISFHPICYVPMIKSKPWYLKLYLRPVHSSNSSVDVKSLNCTLHCKP